MVDFRLAAFAPKTPRTPLPNDTATTPNSAATTTPIKNDAPEEAAGGRAIHDTVNLSSNGQKIVNLARGEQLATDLKGRDVDISFAKDLQKAFEDVFRIGRLFTETIKTAFGAGR